MTNEEGVEKKKGSMIFSLVSYVSINCIRFTGMISAQSTPTNNGAQSIYFVGEGQGDCNISTHSRPKVAAYDALEEIRIIQVSTHSRAKAAATIALRRSGQKTGFNTQPPEGGCSLHKKARKISELNTVFR